jgi:hypothetical protein
MTSLADTRLLFVIAAGSRGAATQFAHYLAVARAIGVRPLIAVPSDPELADLALSVGADVVPNATPRVITALQPDVMVVDDPVAAQMGGWIIEAQRAGVLVLTLSDLGLTPERAPLRRARKVVPVAVSAPIAAHP